jgi:predicted SAM-dependent methyltransferase
MRRLELWKLERKLRRLQDHYYAGDAAGAAAVAAEYSAILESARRLWLGGIPRLRAVHLGAGGHRLTGWVNVDLAPPGVDVLADFAAALPFRTGAVDFLHSEDLIEHLELDAGKALVAECHRVLRPGGVMRILTPDLRALIEQVYLERRPSHLEWCGRHLTAEGACEALNTHLRMHGEHRFVYDAETLTAMLRAAGFLVRRVRFNWSPVRELRYLDLRDFGLNLFLEGVKSHA